MHDPCCKDDTNISLKPFLCSMLVDEPAKTKLTDLSAQNEKCNKKSVASLSFGEVVGVGSRGFDCFPGPSKVFQQIFIIRKNHW